MEKNNYETSQHLPITTWADEDKPREKMILQGRQHLSDAELMGILLGSGSRECTAVELGRQILTAYDNNLQALAKASLQELMKHKGVGEAKAITIAAALELGQRRHFTPARERSQIRSSKDAWQILAPMVLDLPHEVFLILILNRANKVMAHHWVSSGGVSGTVVDARMVFRRPLEMLASGVVLCHNHPSGSLQPSNADIDLTRKLKQAGQSLDIAVIDHLIISENGYYSFADEGHL